MEKPVVHYWNKRLMDMKEILEGNHFEVTIADDLNEAKKVVLEECKSPDRICNTWDDNGKVIPQGKDQDCPDQ